MSLIRRVIPRVYGKALVNSSTQFESLEKKPHLFHRETAKPVKNPILDQLKNESNPYGLPGSAREFKESPFGEPDLVKRIPLLMARKKPRKKRRTVCREDPEPPTTDLWGKPLKAYRDIQPPCIDPYGTKVNWRRFRPIGTFRMYRYEDSYPDQKP